MSETPIWDAMLGEPGNPRRPESEPPVRVQQAGSDASACDFGKPKAKGWCVKGHSAICDHLCALWSCKHEHQEALLAPRPNVKVSDAPDSAAPNRK